MNLLSRIARLPFWPAVCSPRWVLSFAAPALLAAASTEFPLPQGHQPQPAITQPPSLEMFVDQPGPHRHLYFEEIAVTDTGVNALVRAGATIEVRMTHQDLDNQDTISLDHFTMDPGDSRAVSFTPKDPSSLLVLTWTNEQYQRSSLTLRADQLPYPLPAAVGPYCGMKLTSITWAPGTIKGTLEAECAQPRANTFHVLTETGHLEEATLPARRDSSPTGYTSAITLTVPETGATTQVVPNPEGYADFSIPSPNREGFHRLQIDGHFDVSLTVSAPSYVETIYFPPYEAEYHR